jgi:hemolysin activation/secretion protein
VYEANELLPNYLLISIAIPVEFHSAPATSINIMTDKSPKKLTFSWSNLSLLILLFSTTTRPLNAQTVETTQLPNLPPPQDIQPPTPQPSPELPQPLPPPAELLPPSQPTTPPTEKIPNTPTGTVTVERFEIVGSTVFSQEELAKAVSDFINRPISLAELYQARSRITDLYVNNGYITSGAYIPPQEIRSGSGVVKIQVLEGKFERIKISGTQGLSDNYVRDRIEVNLTGPANQKRLLEALQLLQLNPLIENLSAELSAGSRVGTNVLEVKIKEADTFNTQIVLDNGRSPAVGSFRRRIQLGEANLLGLGDSLGLGYTNTDGSNSFDVGYTIPINPQDGTLSFNYATTSADVIEKPFTILDIQSDSRYYELTFRQPVVKTATQEFALGITASRKESEASYVNEGFGRTPFPSNGADEKGNTRVSAIRFFQEWTSRNNRQVIALRSPTAGGYAIAI